MQFNKSKVEKQKKKKTKRRQKVDLAEAFFSLSIVFWESKLQATLGSKTPGSLLYGHTYSHICLLCVSVLMVKLSVRVICSADRDAVTYA